MKVRSLAVGLLVGGLVLSACGKEGDAPEGGGGSAPDEAALPTYEVAQNVEIANSPTFKDMQSRGDNKLVMGVKDDQPGLGYKDPRTNEYSGFDIEIGRMVAAAMGYKANQIEYKPVPSEAREQAIINGDVDFYVGTYTMSDERKQQVGFAGPYFEAGQGLLVRSDEEEIKGKDTLKGKKVCSATGSTPIQNVREQKLTENSNIVEFQGYSQCVDKLLGNEVDAVTTDDAILAGYAAEDPEEMKLVGDTFSEEPYGIGLAKEDKALRDFVNDELETSIEEGTWQEIYDATLGKSGAKAETPKIDRY
ncbi:amino acid ABC transporter substrate-binding protein (PAAT family) [Tamaricihabitans halophyticus]|uniref:Amino acid ABC transporter substrate-binding protein (PAAT family) n=1 Tax=Tamaricihabitans halophyticus TaxID=1262583 RepID=A0A4R2R6E9_9PSEU|nr:glutamate ABC transporter substrate-binding protein [Tamaricihabitans halophyticus]TCP55171.1 amino acid ABC transporter substrate-binding protein (PAAT family) [Tamaricihabitans halophyticus]